MKVAFIIMSILGCDDSGTQCVPVAISNSRWTTIAPCDLASEKELETYSNANYPMVVAVCQTASDDTLTEAQADVYAQIQATEPSPPPRKGLTARALALVTNSLPTAKGLKTIVQKPVHLVEDTYSWVARKFAD